VADLGTIRIAVDLERCLGAQNCRHIAPAVFEIGDDGLSHVKSQDPAQYDAAVEAAQSCPSGAISVTRSQP
jgi:ferredoxin